MPWHRFGSRWVRQRERAEEMRAHLDLYAEELVARGWLADDARREARLKFGNPRVKLEEVDALNRIPVIETRVPSTPRTSSSALTATHPNSA